VKNIVDNALYIEHMEWCFAAAVCIMAHGVRHMAQGDDPCTLSPAPLDKTTDLTVEKNPKSSVKILLSTGDTYANKENKGWRTYRV